MSGGTAQDVGGGTFAADVEEAEFRDWLSQGATRTVGFADSLFARFVDALDAIHTGTGSTTDLAVLLRQVLRRASERDGIERRLRLPAGFCLEIDSDWEQFGLHVSGLPDGDFQVGAISWCPPWLADSEACAVDRCSVAGTFRGERAVWLPIAADPFFESATGYATYRTPGQRAAVRAALSTPPGGSLVALLPTGSGKTEIALALARTATRATTVVVVPTIALAYDFERRFRSVFNTPSEPFAWTSETAAGERELLTQRMLQGIQPLLVTSPESLTETIRTSLVSAASAGRIRALVVDEAHLISQWGRAFRPQYRELAHLHQELVRAAPSEEARPVALLLSATLPPHELNDLYEQFSAGPFSVVAANSLRPEHDWWVASPCTSDERRERVIEAALHLPRPLVLYATRPEQANEWVDALRSAGFRRIGIVTGTTPGRDRREVLEQLRSGEGDRSGVDIVVATSAFGLGIDYDQIRSVVHVCVPETADRWYQEVGRSGRDGHAAVGLLIPSIGPGEDDLTLARGLGPKALRPETASRRWAGLWSKRRELVTDHGKRTFLDVDSAVGDAQQGSYNLKWNRQLLQGLDELGVLRRRFVAWQDGINLGLSDSETAGEHQWVEVELTSDFPGDDFFQCAWDSWREPILEANEAALSAVMSVVSEGRAVCDVLSEYYAPPLELLVDLAPSLYLAQPHPPCGRCPDCRLRRQPAHAWPPPTPPNAWLAPDVGQTGPLRRLLDGCPTCEEGRVALLVADDESVVQELVDRVAALGIRWFVGCAPTNLRNWYFIDDFPGVPQNQPPVAGLVVLRAGERVDPWWLKPDLRRAMFRRGTRLPPVILVSSSLEDSLRNRPHLPALTALALLKGAE